MITTMYLRWPFPAGEVADRQVSREQMNKELAKWVTDEEEEVRAQYERIYTESLKDAIKHSPRLTKRYNALGLF